MSTMTFAEFSAANRRRCEEAFGRKVEPETAVAIALGLAEEAGEVAGALRTHLGISKGKKGGLAELGDEISDLVTYADLLASCFGLSLAEVLAAKFNRVSDRVGSPIKLALASPSPKTRGTATACETCKGAREVLYVYARGPGDFPGNAMIPCPTCRPAPGAAPWSPHDHEAKATAWGGGASGAPGDVAAPAAEPGKPPVVTKPGPTLGDCPRCKHLRALLPPGATVECSHCGTARADSPPARTPAAGTAPTKDGGRNG